MKTEVIELVAPGVFLKKPVDLGRIAPHDVRLKFHWTAICGSDVSRFEARRTLRYPMSIGHEFVAEIVEIGSDVDGFVIGEVVTSDLNYRCLKCAQCKAGRSHLCGRGQVSRFSNRGFAGHADIDASYLYSLSGNMQPHMALAEPLSCVLHAKDWAMPGNDDRILIVGAGSLGTCLAFGLSNESPALKFDIAESVPSRLKTVLAATSRASRSSGKPDDYDLVFDLSGTESGLLTALQSVRPGGRVCSMSHLDGYSDANFLLRQLTRRDITFTVSYLNGEAETVNRAAFLLADHWSEVWTQTLEVKHVSELTDAFSNYRTRDDNKTIIDVGSLGS